MNEKPRPIRPRIIKRANPYRIPEQGALTPRLRAQDDLVGAIGFTHDFQEQEDESRDRR